MARKLKVFQAQFGFHDSVVAASSQAEALRLWGTHQNLFAEGQAHLASDPAAIEAALAHPLIPLRRAVGTSEPFGLDPGLPPVPDEPRRAPARASKTRSKQPAPKPPDRSALDAAEAALRDLDEARQDELAGFAERRSALEAEEEASGRRFDKARSEAEAIRAAALKTYRKAGGRS